MQDFPRLHIAATDWMSAPDAIGALSAAQAHYLGTVLRREAGARVVLFGAGVGEWLAELVSIRRDKASVRLIEQLRAPARTAGAVLVVAMLKRDAGDLVIRMGTELGVERFVCVTTERTNVSRVNMDRWRAIATEAAEQCERLDVPEIAEPCRLADLLGQWPTDRNLFAAIERAALNRAELHGFSGATAGDGLLIGPEGGFSPAEIEMIRSRSFVRTVSLGPRILRADTAVAAGLALLGQVIG